MTVTFTFTLEDDEADKLFRTIRSVASTNLAIAMELERKKDEPNHEHFAGLATAYRQDTAKLDIIFDKVLAGRTYPHHLP